MTPILPELFLGIAGMVLLIKGVLKGNAGTKNLCYAVIACFAVAIFLLFGFDWGTQTIANDMFIMDRFAGLMKLLILFGLIISMALSVRYLEQESMARFEYPILVLFAGLGMMLMVSANNLLSLYMALELQSLSLYVLASFQRHHLRSAEAGIKYFVLGALASGMLLFGCSLVYGYTGSVNFTNITAALGGANVPMGVIIGMVFVIVGLAFKISAVPFHMWTPDVYQGAPTCVTAFFAIVPKAAAMALIIRVLFEPFGPLIEEWQQVVYALALGSMVLGAFAALAQNNLKRLLAYSSIGNMGYAMIGLVAATPEGVSSVIVYMTLYMVMTAGVFGIVFVMRRNEQALEEISDLSGFSKHNPMLAYGMAVLLLSMMGIPPLAGFFGKMLVFNAAVSEGFYILAVLGVLTSVVAAYYYLRIIKTMFFDEPADKMDKDIAFSVRAVIFVSVVFVLLFILSPNVIISISESAAQSLFVG